MKKKLQLIGLVFYFLFMGHMYAQENDSVALSSAEQTSTKKFTNEEKRFNDWSVALFAGGNVLQGADFTSWGDGRFTPGYDFQLQVTKQITHAYGITLGYQMGRTNQFMEHFQHYDTRYAWDAKTEYQAISLLGDLNLSALLRRVDNESPYRWAHHFYGGVGIMGYKASRIALDSPEGFKYHDWEEVTEVTLGSKSIYWQIGTGVMYKINNRFDIELRGMYVITGDEEFDASGDPSINNVTLADYEEGRDDNLFTLSLGLHYKIGKHDEHLRWHDPLKQQIAAPPVLVPCIDDDNDGVCNPQDKCPDTPEGYRVDGAGCPLDSDNDGVADTIDECPTIPGPPTNNGCPKPIVEVSVGNIADNLTKIIEGIEFDYDKDVIRPVSYPKLNAAFDVLQAHPDYKFYVEGHTDAAGSVQYNQNLSERRAASVVRYLVNKGIPQSQLVPVGKGESDLKHKECDPVTNCPAWKNLENRRVVFKPYGQAIENLDYVQ